jgi:hypothetical protein
MGPLNFTGIALPMDLRATVLSILVAFASSHALAMTYLWSIRGLSYSQPFVQTLVMASVGAAMMMLVISNNLVWGIGMVGALALVRFRTNLRDPRDMIFVFVSLVVGIASGIRAYSVAVAGTALFCLIAMYLSRVTFGLRSYFDALLRFTLSGANQGSREVTHSCLNTHCSRFVLAMVQQIAEGDATEHVYQVRFRREKSRLELMGALERVPGLTNLSLMLEETRVEV